MSEKVYETVLKTIINYNKEILIYWYFLCEENSFFAPLHSISNNVGKFFEYKQLYVNH